MKKEEENERFRQEKNLSVGGSRTKGAPCLAFVKGQNTSSRNEPTTTKKQKWYRNNHLLLPVRCDIAPPMQQQKQPTRNNNVNRFILLDGMVIRPVGLRRPTDVMTRVIRHHNNLQDNNLSIQFFLFNSRNLNRHFLR